MAVSPCRECAEVNERQDEGSQVKVRDEIGAVNNEIVIKKTQGLCLLCLAGQKRSRRVNCEFNIVNWNAKWEELHVAVLTCICVCACAGFWTRLRMDGTTCAMCVLSPSTSYKRKLMQKRVMIKVSGCRSKMCVTCKNGTV